MGSDVIEIVPLAANLLKKEVIHAFKSIPRRGAETGGLLCGELLPQLRIDAVVPVPSEYRFGPTWRLSDTDKNNFRQAIASNTKVIGWYRSHTRKDESVTEEDRDITRLFFGVGQSAFLICFPDAQYNVNGQLRIWTEGRKERVCELPLGRFSLLEDALQAADQEDESPEAVPLHVPAPLPPASTPPAALVAPGFTAVASPRRFGRFASAAMIGGVALTLLCGAAVLFRNPFVGSPGTTVHANTIGLGMKVDRQGKALLINWDRQSAAVLEATNATFTINENARTKVIHMSVSELRTGGVLYTPQTDDDVQVELSVQGPGGNFAQSIRIVQNGN